MWTPESYARIKAARKLDPEYEWPPFWEYGAFIDVRDLARACHAALVSSLHGYVRMFLASSDITTSGRTSLELVRALLPDVIWRGDSSYLEKPYQTLIRIDEARRLLAWEPRFTWQRYLASGTTS